MPKMSAIDLKALLSAERYDALSAMAASKLSDGRASALNYYMGDMSKDMPEIMGSPLFAKRLENYRQYEAVV
jgi:hypothetical protein